MYAEITYLDKKPVSIEWQENGMLDFLLSKKRIIKKYLELLRSGYEIRSIWLGDK